MGHTFQTVDPVPVCLDVRCDAAVAIATLSVGCEGSLNHATDDQLATNH